MARPPRLENFPYTGLYRYFLTTCTFDRAERFRDASVVEQALSQILPTASEYDVAVTTYCFMPDHVHLLATGLTDSADVTSFVKLSKQRTGWRFRRMTGRYLWQEGFYDHVLRDEEGTANVVRYIINNPVRAGLVVSPTDYAFWGSQLYSRDELLAFIQGAEEWRPDWRRDRRV